VGPEAELERMSKMEKNDVEDEGEGSDGILRGRPRLTLASSSFILDIAVLHLRRPLKLSFIPQ
jgi:hypothetical protein